MKLEYTKQAKEHDHEMVEFIQKVFLDNLDLFKRELDVPWDKVHFKIMLLDYMVRGESLVSNTGIYRIHVSASVPRAYSSVFITIAHELIHLQQYHQKTMRFANAIDHVFWKGQLMKMHVSGPEYTNSPWEVEAREVSTRLWRQRVSSQGTIWQKFLLWLGLWNKPL